MWWWIARFARWAPAPGRCRRFRIQNPTSLKIFNPIAVSAEHTYEGEPHDPQARCKGLGAPAHEGTLVDADVPLHGRLSPGRGGYAQERGIPAFGQGRWHRLRLFGALGMF